MAVLGLRFCMWAFSSCGEWELLSSCGAGASHSGGFSCCQARALWSAGSSSCGTQAQLPLAGGTFWDQGLNPHPLHWQAYS